MKVSAPTELAYNELHPENSNDKKKNPPIDLTCVLDTSGSMSGVEIDSPIRLLAETMMFIISRLRLGDSLGMVAFNSSANVLADMTKIESQTTRDMLTQIAQKIIARGFAFFSFNLT